MSKRDFITQKYEEFIIISKSYLGEKELFEPIETLDINYLYEQLKTNFNTNRHDIKNYNSFKYLLKYKGISFADKSKKKEYFQKCMDFIIEILNV